MFVFETTLVVLILDTGFCRSWVYL